jgi:hypothetical protein
MNALAQLRSSAARNRLHNIMRCVYGLHLPALFRLFNEVEKLSIPSRGSITNFWKIESRNEVTDPDVRNIGTI